MESSGWPIAVAPNMKIRLGTENPVACMDRDDSNAVMKPVFPVPRLFQMIPFFGASWFIRLSIGWICVLAGVSCLAQDGNPPVLVSEKSLHQPTPVPDRVVLTWSGNPATTQAITWRTDVSVEQAWVEIMQATDNPLDFKGVRVLAQTRAFSSDLGESHYHSVELSDLEPNCIYAYRVGDGVNWTEWQHFRTAKQESAPFSFIYFGDAQNDIRMHWSRVFRESFRLAPDAAFTLHAGDLINHAQNDADCGSRCSMPSRLTW